MSTRELTQLARRDEERHLLAAVDESANSRRAVMYLADFFCKNTDVFITLLSIIPAPSEDYFPTEAKRQEWIAEQKQMREQVLQEYKDILLDAGFAEDKIRVQLTLKPCTSIGDAILEEQDKLKCCIVVVGRRGISHDEEFVFGSTSNKILHHAKKCAVMIVE